MTSSSTICIIASQYFLRISGLTPDLTKDFKEDLVLFVFLSQTLESKGLELVNLRDHRGQVIRLILSFSLSLTLLKWLVS